jgi:hypothetical protein
MGKIKQTYKIKYRKSKTKKIAKVEEDVRLVANSWGINNV